MSQMSDERMERARLAAREVFDQYRPTGQIAGYKGAMYQKLYAACEAYVRALAPEPSEPRVVAMRRFLLFSGPSYYPLGGWEDFKGSFDTLEQALSAPREEWWQIVDLSSGAVVASGHD